jgi:hypothetical protein
LLAAKRIAWHPTRVSEPAVSHGAALLGAAGMDIGLLDEVVNHQTIRAQEREAFFQMVDAVGQMDVRQLIRSAQENISAVRQAWAGELEAADLQRRRLAQSVVELADDGRYSVAPLFLAADSQVGRLVAFDGMARRAARIEVGVSPEGEPSDIVRRFGIDHYYELELFTDDSQNLPVVFCARELPLGFPTGNDIRQPVRVAGFFFKSWRYQPLGAGASAEAAAGQAAQPPLIAPLLIGPAPLPLPVEQGRAAVVSWIGGGLFLLALAGIWVVAWSYARGDRKSRLSTAAGRYSLPPGQSLDVLDVSAASASITESDQARPDAGRSP